MCIKIVNAKEEFSYDMNKPLEEQIKGSKQIVINYDPKDLSIEKFLDEMERLCKHGVTANLNIKFNHNNYLAGARSKKELIQVTKDLSINDVIKMMTTMQAQADKKLEEIASCCFKENEYE